MPSLKPLSAACALRSEIGMRSRNDDAAFARVFEKGPWLGIFAVADGVSGHLGGGEAAALAIGRVAGAAREIAAAPATDPARAARDTVAGAILDIAAMKRSHPMKKHAGTTFTMLIVHDDRGYIYHAGDSRLYRRRDGLWMQLTEDHTVGWRLVGEGALRLEDYPQSPMRKRLYRYLGKTGALVARSTFAILPGDEFLLATDGCFDRNGILPIPALPFGGYDAAATIDALFASRELAGHEDNATVVYAVVR